MFIERYSDCPNRLVFPGGSYCGLPYNARRIGLTQGGLCFPTHSPKAHFCSREKDAPYGTFFVDMPPLW
jgi:hypothetical protein